MIDSRNVILVIDDEQRIRDIYVRALVEEGLIVRTASNTVEAEEILKQEDIDLVILDIHMPGFGGQTMLNIIREHNDQIKVIVASVYPLHVQRMMIKNVHDYYDKSHGAELLLKKIYSTLSLTGTAKH